MRKKITIVISHPQYPFVQVKEATKYNTSYCIKDRYYRPNLFELLQPKDIICTLGLRQGKQLQRKLDQLQRDHSQFLSDVDDLFQVKCQNLLRAYKGEKP
jgi:hypothetical protein